MADRILQFVYSNPRPGREDEFNDWYENVHIPDILAVPGVVSARRYKLRETEITHQSGMPLPDHTYVCVYEVEGEPNDAMRIVRERVGDGTIFMSDALAVEESRMSFWDAVGPRHEAHA